MEKLKRYVIYNELQHDYLQSIICNAHVIFFLVFLTDFLRLKRSQIGRQNIFGGKQFFFHFTIGESTEGPHGKIYPDQNLDNINEIIRMYSSRYIIKFYDRSHKDKSIGKRYKISQ